MPHNCNLIIVGNIPRKTQSQSDGDVVGEPREARLEGRGGGRGRQAVAVHQHEVEAPARGVPLPAVEHLVIKEGGLLSEGGSYGLR